MVTMRLIVNLPSARSIISWPRLSTASVINIDGAIQGGPIDNTLRHQVTSEAFYRLQFTEHLAVTPNVQFTLNPSHTLDTDALWVAAVLRLRLAL